VAAVEGVAGEAPRPLAALWGTVDAYVEGFRAHRRMGLLWFEYSSWTVRNGYEQGVASSVDAIRRMFARRLARPADHCSRLLANPSQWAGPGHRGVDAGAVMRTALNVE